MKRLGRLYVTLFAAPTIAPLLFTRKQPSISFRLATTISREVTPHHMSVTAGIFRSSARSEDNSTKVVEIKPRSDWLAQPVVGESTKLNLPVRKIVIQHTASKNGLTEGDCAVLVRHVQMFHVEGWKWSDIGYNFLVCGDGNVYEGRGWNTVGAHTIGQNYYSLGIAFTGTFIDNPPPQRQIDALKYLLEYGVKNHYITEDYELHAHCQYLETKSPGAALYNILKTYKHYKEVADSKCNITFEENAEVVKDIVKVDFNLQ